MVVIKMRMRISSMLFCTGVSLNLILNTEIVGEYYHILYPSACSKDIYPRKSYSSVSPELSDVYSPFVNAIRNADIKAFDVALFKWEKWLIDHRVYWLFERTRELVMRGLFRKV